MTETGTALGDALTSLAASDPDRPAITHEDTTITRADLERRVNRLARAYLDRGVTQDSFVTIALPNSIEFFEATLATWKVGATPQPLSSSLPARERDAILNLVKPSLVVGMDPDAAGPFASVPRGFEPDPAIGDSPLPACVARSLKAPTSGGSTGRPKLIVAEQPAVLESVTPFGALLSMKPDGVHLVTGPMYHNGPFLTSLCALYIGCHVVVMTRFDASHALELIERHRVDWMYAVPTMMQRIWRLPEEERLARDVSSLEVVFHLAAPCPPTLKEAWIRWLGPEKVLELYGATEAQAFTILDGREWLEHRGSVGKPVLGEFSIRDADGNPVEQGTIGEVWMRRGPDAPAPYRYIGADPRQADDGWESVGDMGWMDADGYLYLADRETDMVLVGGSNVYPAEVEAALMEHPAVLSACVIGLPDDDLGNILHAIVETNEPVDDDELDRHMRERVVTYKVPRSWERTNEPIRDDAGKVRRGALRAERIAASATANA